MHFSYHPKKLLKEGQWSAFGKILSALGTLLGVRLLTEFVNKEAYGQISLLIGAMTLGVCLFASPLTSAAQRFHSELAMTGNISLLRKTIISLLRWPIILLAGTTLLLAFFIKSIPWSVFLALAFLLVFQILRNMEVSFLTAARRQKEVALISISESWFKPGLAVLIIFVLGSSSLSILLGYSIATGGTLLIFYLLPVKVEGAYDRKDVLQPDKMLKKNIIHYSLPLIPLALVAWVSSLSDRYIIGSISGVGQVGIYAAGYGLISMPFLMVEGIVGQTLRPAYFQALSSNDSINEKKILKTQLIATVTVCGLGVLAVCFLKNILVWILLAEEYRQVAVLLPWIALGIGFQVIAHIYEGVLMAHKKTLKLLAVHTIGAVVSIVSVFLLCSKYGLYGAAIACPIYYLSMLIAGIVFTLKLT